MRRWRATTGQATSEYVALVALVATVLTLAAGLTSGGAGGHVLAGIQHGLCRVADIRCPRPERPRDELDPCPVERREEDEQLATTIASVRLGANGTLTVVRGSDGRATVTLWRGKDAGLQAEGGARLRVGRHVRAAYVAAGAGVAWTSGRSWRFPDVAAARAFVDTYGRKATIGGQLLDGARSYCSLLCDAIGWRPHAELPEPDEVYAEAGPAGRLTAALGVADDSFAAGAMLGRRRARDGGSTWYVRLDAQAVAGLALPDLGLDVDADTEAVLGYELDAAQRPLALHVTVTDASSLDAGPMVGRTPVTAGAAEGVGAVAELSATLDLREPAIRAAAAALLDALGDSGALASVPERVRALGVRIVHDARIDRRRYVLRRDETGVGAGVGLVAKVDGEFDRTTTVLELVDAQTRLPGLPFLPRDDCRHA